MGFLYPVDGQLARSDRPCDLRGITDDVIVPIAGLSLGLCVVNFSFSQEVWVSLSLRSPSSPSAHPAIRA